MRRPRVRPVVWEPRPAPPRARRRFSDRPLPPLRLLDVAGTGPEDVAVDSADRILTGVEDGRILRLSADGSQIETLASTGGRPLGIELLGDGRLLVCDACRGLLRLDPDSGQLDVLLGAVGGVPMRFCNNAAVAADGTVYASDTSRRFGIEHWRADLLEHSGTGRLLRLGTDGAVEVLVDGLQFANGVALAADESFVAVVETGAYRLTRYWLTGPRAGRTDLLIDNLPAFPDNISTGSDGLIWIAMASPRDPALDRLLPRHPVWRTLVWALPGWARLRTQRSVWVLAVDDSGAVVHDLQGEHESFAMVTGVREVGGTLYLGSLISTAVATFNLR